QTILDRGYTIYLIPLAAAACFRRSLAPTGKKSDGFDCTSAGLYVLNLGHTMRPLTPDAPEVVALRQSVIDRTRLVADRTAKINDLHSQLKRFYPAFIGLFGNLTSRIALRFLQDFPAQDGLRALTPRRLKGWLKKHGYTQSRRVDGMVAKLTAPVFEVPASLQQAKAAHIRYCAKTIETLNDEIAARDAANQRQFDQWPDASIYRSLPGVGATLAPALAAVFGRDVDRFEDSTRAQAYLGTAPVTRASGRQRSVVFRRACCKFARRTLQLFAQQTLTTCAWAEAFYRRQRQTGHRHHAALRALANKWVKIILAMQRTGTPYDDARYTAACEQRLSGKRPAFT
ncbi:MAG: transposase, partial [Planctomycetales bacterium]|nr:transposase [Planctomycetales bacterium]